MTIVNRQQERFREKAWRGFGAISRGPHAAEPTGSKVRNSSIRQDGSTTFGGLPDLTPQCVRVLPSSYFRRA